MTRGFPPLLALLLAAASPAGMAVSSAGAAEDAKGPPTLVVTGRAILEAAPDFASVSVGVTNRAPTTAAALDATSAAAARIAAAAKGFGIADRDVQTGTVSLQPVFRQVRDGAGNVEPKPDGYSAVNAVVVRVRDLSRLGEFLRSVVDDGANQIGGIGFELADPGRLERQALAAAVRDARAQADVIADAAGVRIGRIESITPGGGYRPMPRPAAPTRAMAAREPVPVQSGSLDVSSEVQVTFSLAQP